MTDGDGGGSRQQAQEQEQKKEKKEEWEKEKEERKEEQEVVERDSRGELKLIYLSAKVVSLYEYFVPVKIRAYNLDLDDYIHITYPNIGRTINYLDEMGLDVHMLNEARKTIEDLTASLYVSDEDTVLAFTVHGNHRNILCAYRLLPDNRVRQAASVLYTAPMDTSIEVVKYPVSRRAEIDKGYPHVLLRAHFHNVAMCMTRKAPSLFYTSIEILPMGSANHVLIRSGLPVKSVDSRVIPMNYSVLRKPWRRALVHWIDLLKRNRDDILANVLRYGVPKYDIIYEIERALRNHYYGAVSW